MTYSRILVATDLSEGSGTAAALARRIGHARARYRVVLVRAPAWPTLTRAGEEAADLEARVARWAREHGLENAEIRLPRGSVAGEIAREADDMRADLIVVGHEGTGRARRRLLGSTARAVLRSARMDTLVARQDRAIARLLVATDFHDASVRAARAATELAKAQGSEREIVHVVDPSLWYDPGFDPGTPTDGGIDPEVRERLAAFAREHFTGASETLLHGSPAAALAEHAEKTPVDLVVIGDHGAGRLERAMIGSAAESIAELAPCSVLVVRDLS